MATNVARIQAELDLDSGQFTGKLVNAAGQVKRFSSALDDSSKSLRNIERRVTGFGSTVRDSMVVLGQFRASMLTLWAGSGQWVGAIIKANAELERMQALMKGVAKGSDSQRNAQAQSDMQYVIDMAQRAPFSISAIGDSIVKLRSAGIEAKSTMEGLTNAVAAFGGNDETLKRATVAIQQMAGKGVVSMEELRQQLGEAVPTAMRLMARGLGVSMAELTKKVSLGTVEAINSIKAMTLEMNREYEGAARDMMKTWVGMTAKLKTEWMLFAKNIGDAGLFDAAKEGLRQLSDIMKDPNTINSAVTLGKALGEMITAFSTGVKWIVDNQNALVAWGKAIGTIVAGGYVLSMIRNLTFLQAAMNAVKMAAMAGAPANQGFIRSFAGMGVMGQATALAGGLKAGLNSLLMTFTGFGGPIGIAIAAIGALIGWMVKLRVEAEQTMSALNRVMNLRASEFASMEDIEKAKTKLEDYERFANRIANQRKEVRWNPEQDRSMLMSIASELNDMTLLQKIKDADAKGVAELMTSMESNLRRSKVTLQQNIDRSGDNLRIFNEKKFVDGNVERLDDSVGKVADEYRKRQAEFEEEMKGKDQKAINAGLDRLAKQSTEGQVKVLDQQISVLETQLSKMSGLDKEYTQNLLNQRKVRRQALITETAELLKMRQAGIQFLNGPPKDPNAAKKERQDAESLQTQLERLIGRNAQLKAQVSEDMIPTLAKFNAALAGGAWGGAKADQGVVAQIRALLKANDELADSLKKNKATEKLSGDLDEMAAKASADVMTESLKQSGDVYSKVAAGMVGFNREVAVMRLNLDKTNMSSKDFEARVKEIQATMFKLDMTRFADWVVDSNVENNTAVLEDRDRVLAEHNETLRQYQILRANLIKTADGDQAQIDVINKGVDSVIASQQKRFNYESRSEWQQWLDNYRDITKEMESVWSMGLDNMTNSLSDMFVSGKSGWRDYATSILKEISRVMTAKVVGQFVEFAMGFFGSGGVTASQAPSGTTFGNNLDNFKGGTYANGGIHSASGSMPLHKYAKGGIANTPQMALFGEGRLPEAYVPLPDGRSIPVTMEGTGGDGATQNNVSVNVTVNSDGSADGTVESNAAQGRELGKALQVAVRKTLQEEMRPGGALWKANNR